ncbi:MAG: hypothetical protein WBD40_02505 [Tepidisphaeraceae bacterium]
MKRTSLRAGLIVLAMAVAGSAIALAAPAPAKKPASIVTIKKQDGTTVRGQLVSAEPGQLVVKAPGAAGETVNVRWSQIARVSNGLTQEQAAEQFRTLHKDELCADCHGEQGLRCKDCHGTAFDQSKLVDCTDCGGAGMFFCPNKKCDDGQIDCPAPCIKLSEGRWTVKDGKRIRTMGRGGWVSDGHLGELFDTKGGALTSLGKCPACQGTTKVDCPDCDGMAYKICGTCYFEGKVGPPCPTCEGGKTPCPTCSSTGLKKAA